MKTVLCWDIDGTLLTTGKAGIFAYEAAVKEVLGKEINLWELETGGLIDPEIAAKIIGLCNVEPTEDLISELLDIYGKRLPGCLGMKKGHAIEGVEEFLESIKDREDIKSIILTGNIKAGAEAKLEYYGLSKYFKYDGAFSDGMKYRASIACKAVEIVETQFKITDRKQIYVIGDTPYDIKCGKAIKAKTVAVCTGKYKYFDLKNYYPDYLINSISDSFLKVLKVTS